MTWHLFIFFIDNLYKQYYIIYNEHSKQRWRGGVHFRRMRREKMDGESLREVEMEVALELWIERYNCFSAWCLLDFNGFPPLQGNYIGLGPYR